MSVYDKYETVIGLEVHCQLSTTSKAFGSASTEFGAPPNTHVTEVELGLPGALPVLNRQAVELAMRAGFALGCDVQPWSQFARKNYFYPDLPKGYQISQHVHPLCLGGGVDIEVDGEPKHIRLERIHMEEDAGKSSHLAGQPHSVVDLNRAGVPLIEIVSRPDMRSAEEAVAYLKALHTIVVYLEVTDGNMEEGSFRCDANVSVRPRGSDTLGTRTELKNINSFKFVKDAITFEVRRQIDLIEAGGEVRQQTRLYDADRGVTFAMRDKEEAHDYRYFPEPDLPPLEIDEAWRARVRDALPELPAHKRARFVADYGLTPYDAGVLTASRELADYYEAAVAAHTGNPKGVANWITNELLGALAGAPLASVSIRPEEMARLVVLIDEDVISGKIAKKVFAKMLETGDAPDAIIEAQGLRQITDPEALGQVIDEIMAANQDKVAQYRGGKTKLMGFFVGQVMRATQGKGSPAVINELLGSKLGM